MYARLKYSAAIKCEYLNWNCFFLPNTFWYIMYTYLHWEIIMIINFNSLIRFVYVNAGFGLYVKHDFLYFFPFFLFKTINFNKQIIICVSYVRTASAVIAVPRSVASRFSQSKINCFAYVAYIWGSLEKQIILFIFPNHLYT